MDSLRDISPDDLFPGVAYSISEDDGDEDMPYTRPVSPRPRRSTPDQKGGVPSSQQQQQDAAMTASGGLSTPAAKLFAAHTTVPLYERLQEH